MGEAVERLIALANVYVEGHTRIVGGREVHVDPYMRTLAGMSVEDLRAELRSLAQTHTGLARNVRFAQVVNELRRRAQREVEDAANDLLRHHDDPSLTDSRDLLRRYDDPALDDPGDLLRHNGRRTKVPEILYPPGHPLAPATTSLQRLRDLLRTAESA